MSDHTEGRARTDLIREYADELGEFPIVGLAEHLLKEGLWGPFPRLQEDAMRLCMAGAKEQVKRALKGDKMLNGFSAWVALDMGPQATWKKWSNCTRRESRGALIVLRKNERSATRERQNLQHLHEERFRERIRWNDDEIIVER